MNIGTSLLAFIINVGINFKLTPYIIARLGTESYGFIGLANDFVNYAGILTMALNTMSSRFISVEYHRGNRKKAQTYINSVLIANLFLSALVVLAAVFIVWKLEYIINIPKGLTFDVKITFSLVFINYILGICISVLNCAPYVKNRMDKIYIRNAVSYVIKLIITIALITIFDIRIFFISLTSVICTAYLGAASFIIMKKLMPEIKFSLRDFKWSAIKEILSGGVWMSLLSLSNLMLSGLNSLLTNKFISVVATGYLSASKTVPNYIGQLGQQLGQVFSPQITALYSRGEKDKLIFESKKAIRIMALIMTVPIAGFIVFGGEFYTLWLENYTQEEISLIQTLSVISTMPYLFNAYAYPLIQINTALNKVRTPVLATFFIGIANVLIVIPFGFANKLTLILLTIFGSVFMSARLIIFQPIYAAKILKVKKSTFYSIIFKCYFVFMVTLISIYFIKKLFTVTSWLSFLLAAGICGIFGFLIVFLLIFNKNEYKTVASLIKSKIFLR